MAEGSTGTGDVPAARLLETAAKFSARYSLDAHASLLLEAVLTIGKSSKNFTLCLQQQ